MSKFSCTCQNYNGYLNVSAEECYFSSSLFRAEFKWGNVKKIKLDTKQIRGVPTSVLVIGLTRTVSVDDDDGTDSSSRRKRKKKKNASKKYFFYGFQDLLSAEERVKATWEHWKQENASAARDGARKSAAGDDSGDDKDSTTAHHADEVQSDDGSTHAEADTSANSAPMPLTRKGGNASDLRTAPVVSSSAPKRAATVPVPRRVGVDVLAPPTESTVKAVVERILVKFARCTSAVVHYLFKGGLASTVVLAFLVCLLVVTMGQMRFSLRTYLSPSADGPYVETRQLLDSLQHVYEYHRSLGQYVSLQDYYRANQKRQANFEGGAVWVKRLERATKELAEKYVLIQAEMLNLRGRRAERFMAAELGVASPSAEAWRRVFQEGDDRQRKYYLADPATTAQEPERFYDAGDEDSSLSSGRPVDRRTRVFSIHRVVEDIDFWCRTVSRIASWIRYMFALRKSGEAHVRQPQGDAIRFTAMNSHTGGETGGMLIRYKEPFLDGYDLVQYVTPEEEQERRQCLRLTSELVKVSHLMDDVFLGFTALLMADAYEKIAIGTEKPHFWGSSPLPTSVLAAKDKARTALRGLPVFTSDQVLRVVFIRRYLQALQHLDPREPNEHRRRAEALAFSERLQAFAQRDAELSEHLTEANKEELVELFYDNVLPQSFAHDASSTSATELASTLRNIVEEVKFWDLHESLWMEHLLHSLPPSHRRKLQQLSELRSGQHGGRSFAGRRPASPDRISRELCARAGNGNVTLEALAHCQQRLYWENLPTFKGLLCFTPQPQLRRFEEIRRARADHRAARSKHANGKTSPSSSEAKHTATTASTPGANAPGSPAPAHGKEGDTARRLLPAQGTGARPEALKRVRAHKAEDLRVAPNPVAVPENDTETVENSVTDHRKPIPVPSPYASRYTRMTSAEEEFRRLFDPARLENAVSTSKERWMNELDMFLRSLSLDSHSFSHRGTTRRQRYLHMEHESEGVEPALAHSRARLLALLERLNHLYLLPIHHTASGFLRLLERWLWPPTWVRALLFRGPPHPELEAIRSMATADPAVQLASAQVVGVPWGTDRDAPLILLKHVLMQPPELLKLRVRLRDRLVYSGLLLVVAVASLTAAYMFL